jgi:hypothetical protein
MTLRVHDRHEQESFMRIRKHAAAVIAATGLLAIAIPAASASAATAPTAPADGAPITMPSGLTFVPPRVGPISVDIAATIINGQVVNPGLHVLLPGVSLPPMSWTLPPLR